MNCTIKKHELLKMLAVHYINVQTKKADSHILGISFDDIHKKLNVNHQELLTLTSELFDNAEIGYHNAHNVEGLYAENKGISAYSNKKYLKKYRKSIIDNIKDITQIIIPILSVIIAILAITLKIENFNQKNQKQIDDLKSKIKIMEKMVINSGVTKINKNSR